MKKKLISIQRFWVYSLFHLQIVTFDPTVPLQYWLVFKHPHRKTGEDSSQVRVQAKHWSFTSMTNPGSRIISGQPLTHFTIVIWWSTIVLEPHMKEDMHWRNYWSTSMCSKKINLFRAQWLLYVPPALTYLNSAFCPQSASVCSAWFLQQTVIISLNSINWFGSVVET
jgi:hypothetical protein